MILLILLLKFLPVQEVAISLLQYMVHMTVLKSGLYGVIVTSFWLKHGMDVFLSRHIT